MQHGKRYRQARGAIDREHLYTPLEAIRLVKRGGDAKFDETVEVHFNTGLNVRHADQQLRGTLMLPHGTGKEMRVAVFAEGEKAKEAEEAGADVVGSADLAQRVEEGFEEAATSRGLAWSVHPCEPTAEAVEDLLDRLLREHPDLTSLVVHNEPLVEPTVRALRRHEHRVPDLVSVVAICPDEVAESAPVPITSVRIPAEELGRRAVELLMALLDDAPVPSATLLPPQLTVRASTAPLPPPSP
jgi:hypothetical protein